MSVATAARTVGMDPNHWYPAAFEDEVPAGKTIETAFSGDPIVLYRAADGQLAAFENRCPHRGIKLSLGNVEEGLLTCRYHGWSFSAEGRLVKVHHECFGHELPRFQLRVYPLRSRYGIVWIFPGNPQLAEDVPLVEIPHAEGRERWASIRFVFTWNAHHSMVIDNLCNLTHLYTHGRAVPYDSTYLADHKADGERIEMLWRSRLLGGIDPLTRWVFEGPAGSNLSDTRMVYDYPYQSALSNGRVRSCNFMLPLGPTRTRVFTVQYWKPPQLGRLRLPAALMRPALRLVTPLARTIFEQDGVTVEAEQEAWNRLGERPIPELNPLVRIFNELTVAKGGGGRAESDVPAARRRSKTLV